MIMIMKNFKHTSVANNIKRDFVCATKNFVLTINSLNF